MLSLLEFKLLNWTVHLAALTGGSGHTHWSYLGARVHHHPSEIGWYYREVGRLSHLSPFKYFTSYFQGFVGVRGTFNFTCDFIEAGLIPFPI